MTSDVNGCGGKIFVTISSFKIMYHIDLGVIGQGHQRSNTTCYFFPKCRIFKVKFTYDEGQPK